MLENKYDIVALYNNKSRRKECDCFTFLKNAVMEREDKVKAVTEIHVLVSQSHRFENIQIHLPYFF